MLFIICKGEADIMGNQPMSDKRCGAVVQLLSLLHNFSHQCLNSDSAQAQILLAAFRRFVVVCALMVWSQLEIRLNIFSRSAIPQKHFSIFIIITDYWRISRTIFMFALTCLNGITK